MKTLILTNLFLLLIWFAIRWAIHRWLNPGLFIGLNEYIAFFWFWILFPIIAILTNVSLAIIVPDKSFLFLSCGGMFFLPSIFKYIHFQRKRSRESWYMNKERPLIQKIIEDYLEENDLTNIFLPSIDKIKVYHKPDAYKHNRVELWVKKETAFSHETQIRHQKALKKQLSAYDNVLICFCEEK